MQSYFYDLISYDGLSPGMKMFAGICFKIFLSLLVLLAGALATRAAGWLSNKILYVKTKNMTESKSHTMNTVFISVAKYTIYFFVVCQILSIFGVRIESMLAVAGIGSLAIGLGAQELIKDLITGTSIIIEDQFNVGDLISIEDRSGVVEAIGMRSTRIRGFDGNLYIIPNSEIRIVTNMCKNFNRAIIEIPIAYGHNVDEVIKIISDEMAAVTPGAYGVLTPPNVLGVTNLGERFYSVRVSVDCTVGENWSVEREIRRLLLLRFEKEGIEVNEFFRRRHCIHEESAPLRQS